MLATLVSIITAQGNIDSDILSQLTQFLNSGSGRSNPNFGGTSARAFTPPINLNSDSPSSSYGAPPSTSYGAPSTGVIVEDPEPAQRVSFVI